MCDEAYWQFKSEKGRVVIGRVASQTFMQKTKVICSYHLPSINGNHKLSRTSSILDAED